MYKIHRFEKDNLMFDDTAQQAHALLASTFDDPVVTDGKQYFKSFPDPNTLNIFLSQRWPSTIYAVSDDTHRLVATLMTIYSDELFDPLPEHALVNSPFIFYAGPCAVHPDHRKRGLAKSLHEVYQSDAVDLAKRFRRRIWLVLNLHPRSNLELKMKKLTEWGYTKAGSIEQLVVMKKSVE